MSKEDEREMCVHCGRHPTAFQEVQALREELWSTTTAAAEELAALQERIEQLEAGHKLNDKMSKRFNSTHRLKQTLGRQPTPAEVDAALAPTQETDPAEDYAALDHLLRQRIAEESTQETDPG